ncbi:MAG: hypothetical protein CMJ32_01335 [Phycisphaerae bacterium]|nr:hypothetical protein [Phycisphaerae bacterium]
MLEHLLQDQQLLPDEQVAPTPDILVPDVPEQLDPRIVGRLYPGNHGHPGTAMKPAPRATARSEKPLQVDLDD